MLKIKKELIYLLVVAFIGASAMLLMTYNMGFQWEDYFCFFKWDSEATWTGLGFNGANEHIDWVKLKNDIGNTFVQLRYGIQPLQWGIQYVVLPGLLGHDPFKYHVYRAIVFGIIVFIMGLYIYRFSKSMWYVLIGGVFLTSAPQMWYAMAATAHASTLSLIFIATALYMAKKYLWQPGFVSMPNFCAAALIILLIWLSVITEQQGRYVVFMLIGFLLVSYPSKLKDHWIFLTLLLMISVPVAGIAYKLLFDHSYKIFAVHSWGMRHYDVNPADLRQMLLLIKNNGPKMIYYLNPVMLCVSFLTSIYIVGQKIKFMFQPSINAARSYVVDLIDYYLYILLWTLFSLVLVFYMRGGWSYTILDNFQYDLSLILLPYVILFVFSVYIISKTVERKVLMRLFVFLIMVSSLAFNAKEMNRYIGGIGGWTVGWDNVRRYMEENVSPEEGAILLTPNFIIACFKPNIKVLQADERTYSDEPFSKNKYQQLLGKYKHVYIASNYSIPLYEKDGSFRAVAAIPCYNNSFYDRVKWLLKSPASNKRYIYEYLGHNI